MSAVWYITFLTILLLVWYDQIYLGFKHTEAPIFIRKLTTLEWLALHSAISYTFCSIIHSFKPSWIRAKTMTAAYLGTLTLAVQALVWHSLVNYGRESELNENQSVLYWVSKCMLDGGLQAYMILDGAIIERDYEKLSLKLLFFFDLYMAGWYGMIQNFCRNASKGYSYEIVDSLDSNSKWGLLAIMAVSGFLIKLGGNALLDRSDKEKTE